MERVESAAPWELATVTGVAETLRFGISEACSGIGRDGGVSIRSEEVSDAGMRGDGERGVSVRDEDRLEWRKSRLRASSHARGRSGDSSNGRPSC